MFVPRCRHPARTNVRPDEIFHRRFLAEPAVRGTGPPAPNGPPHLRRDLFFERYNRRSKRKGARVTDSATASTNLKRPSWPPAGGRRARSCCRAVDRHSRRRGSETRSGHEFKDRAWPPAVPAWSSPPRDAQHQVRFITPRRISALDAGESLHPSLAASFEADWTGFLLVLRTVNYTFDRTAAQVFIDGKSIGDDPVRIESGRRPVRIAYRRAAGPARLRIRWKAAHFDWEPIPLERWSHDPVAGPTSQDRLIEKGRRPRRGLRLRQLPPHRIQVSPRPPRARPDRHCRPRCDALARPLDRRPARLSPPLADARQLTSEQSRDAAAYFGLPRSRRRCKVSKNARRSRSIPRKAALWNRRLRGLPRKPEKRPRSGSRRVGARKCRLRL